MVSKQIDSKDIKKQRKLQVTKIIECKKVGWLDLIKKTNNYQKIKISKAKNLTNLI